MVLSIHIKKTDYSSSVLTVYRMDGTTTYARLPNDFEIHDIAHYVVEKQLQLKNAFYGMLSQGYQINDFLLPKNEQPDALQPKNIPQEAIATEHLVNLLTINYIQPNMKMDVLKNIQEILIDKKLSFPKPIDNSKILAIKEELAYLMEIWDQLKNGQELIMELVL